MSINFRADQISNKFVDKNIKIKDNFISNDDAARLCITILVNKMRENKNLLINDEYFLNNSGISLLPLFYKVIFRKLVINFMLLFTDRNRRNLNIKLNLLNYLLYHIAESMIKSHNNLINGLAIERLRIKIQIQIYTLYWHFDSSEPLKISKAMKDLIKMTDDHFNKLIENIDKTKSNDIDELFKKSGRLFYRIAKVAFKNLKSISCSKNSDRSKVESKILNIVITNLQRAYTNHYIRLLHPEHSYFNKISKIYDEILKSYFGFATDEIDKNMKIANPMDIELLERKLIKFNSILKSHQTLDSKKNYDKSCELLRTRMNRVMICFMLRRYEEGLYDCAKLCEENKAYFKAFLFRAHIYYNLEKYPEAIADFVYYLKYRPGDYNAKVWLSLARKNKELKREYIPLPHVTKKMLFVNAFTDEFLIQVKFYADIFLGTNKMLSKAEKSSRVMNALCNLIPNISIEAPVGPAPVKITADTQPREAALAITNMYVQQAEAQKLYIASNIANYHEELKRIVHKIAETIADDFDPQINQLKDYSIVDFAQYSAKKMLNSIGRNKTNPELPIEEQLRQGLFLYKSIFSNGKCLRKEGQHFLSYWFRHIPIPIMERRWTAEGALTRVGIFSTSNHFYSRRGIHEDLSIDRKDKYGYRYGSYEEAFRLGYEKDKEEVALPFLKNK